MMCHYNKWLAAEWTRCKSLYSLYFDTIHYTLLETGAFGIFRTELENTCCQAVPKGIIGMLPHSHAILGRTASGSGRGKC